MSCFCLCYCVKLMEFRTHI
uniref:Uncharacterized protein n=1 Tax=Rhizophora mucronata TaxID=61149 RepID=A0A2P2IT15_RHIMU